MKNTVVSSKGVSSNTRRLYVAPATEVVCPGGKPVMFTTSPGVGGDYDPSLPIDAKKSDLNVEFRDLWED